MSNETEPRIRSDYVPTVKETEQIPYPERTGKKYNKPGTGKQVGVIVTGLAALGVGGGIFMVTHGGDNTPPEITPTPSAEAPTTPGENVSEAPSPVATSEPSPSDLPTEYETSPTAEQSVDLFTPVTTGPFGDEYAPLHSSEVLVPLVSIEAMQAMNYEEFAQQKIEDRLNYLYTLQAEKNKDHGLYFDIGSNFIPHLVVDAWSRANEFAFSSESPEECAKLALADSYYLIGDDGKISEAAKQNAESWKQICINKGEYTSFGTQLFYTDSKAIRELLPTAGMETPQYTSVLSYEVTNSDSDVKDRSSEAIELTIKLDNGQIIVGYARGYDS